MSDAVANDVATETPAVEQKEVGKRTEKSGKIETFNGEPVVPVILFNYVVYELQKGDTIPADERPDEADLRSFVNQKRNAKARAAAQNAALEQAGIQKPTLENPDFRLKQMVKILMANQMDEATATATAKAALGMQ